MLLKTIYAVQSFSFHKHHYIATGYFLHPAVDGCLMCFQSCVNVNTIGIDILLHISWYKWNYRITGCFCMFSVNTKLSQVVVSLCIPVRDQRAPCCPSLPTVHLLASSFVPVQGIRLGVSACMTLICVSSVHLAFAGKTFVSILFSAGLLATNSLNFFFLVLFIWKHFYFAFLFVGHLHEFWNLKSYWVIFIIVKIPSKVVFVPLGRAAKISFCLCLSTDLPSLLFSCCNCCQNDHTSYL